MKIILQFTIHKKYIYIYIYIQVHLKKFEYCEKVHFFIVTYFKKWNFHILDLLHVSKTFQKFFLLILMIRAYSSWN